MNPEEFCAMNRYQQLQELSHLFGLEVGDDFERDLILANMTVVAELEYYEW
jgi:hypothetical protein